MVYIKFIYSCQLILSLARWKVSRVIFLCTNFLNTRRILSALLYCTLLVFKFLLDVDYLRSFIFFIYYVTAGCEQLSVKKVFDYKYILGASGMIAGDFQVVLSCSFIFIHGFVSCVLAWNYVYACIQFQICFCALIRVR